MIATLNRTSGDAAAVPPLSSSGCELADIFRQYGQAYRQTHRLGQAQRKAMWDIEHCRTETLGGYRERCPACGYEREAFRSCRNRNCPKCQSMATAAWVAARRAELLPVPYFHLVFTLPHELNALILYSEGNLRTLLDLLFDATSRTLSTFGREHLGGKVGFVLVLHTWDQRLRAHFHLHGLMASGALSPDGTRWIAGGRDFLFPVHGLALPRTPPSRTNPPPTADLRFPCPSPRDRISNKIVCGGARRCSAAQFNWVLPRRLPASRSPPSESATGADRIKPYTLRRNGGIFGDFARIPECC